MLRKLFLFPLFFCGYFVSFSQNISGTILNKKNNKPMENVTIITNLKTGSVSNALGEYTINIKNIKTITFSYLGYKTKTTPINELKNNQNVVYLEEVVKELNEIQITRVSLDSLLAKTARRMKKNYISGPQKEDFYFFEKERFDYKDLKLAFKSSSLINKENKKLAKKEFEEFSNDIRKNSKVFYKEFIGKLILSDSTSIIQNKKQHIRIVDSIVGFSTKEPDKNISAKNISNNLQNIVLKHLNNKETYKIKSGLYTAEDSISIKKIQALTDSINKDNSYSIFKAIKFKEIIDEQGLFINAYPRNNFFNTKYYNQKIEANEKLGSDSYYVVSFHPKKSKAKFSGKIYIDPYDFAIKKLVYNYSKGKKGNNVNLKWLFGIQFTENTNQNIIYYETTNTGKIYAAYYKNQKESYIYVDRPITFIENSKAKEKLKMNIRFELNTATTIELLFSNPVQLKTIATKTIKAKKINPRKQYISEEVYKTTTWQNKKPVIDYLKKYQ